MTQTFRVFTSYGCINRVYETLHKDTVITNCYKSKIKDQALDREKKVR